jgi:nucleoside-diphosphate-sugar epimerase
LKQSGDILMANVLITGGTGFVGHWMLRTIPDGVSCTYLDQELYKTEWEKLTPFDVVVHLANIAPTRVIEYCKEHNARLLYCSSGIVYHQENDIEYRRNKTAWEKECMDSGVDVVIARLFTFCGEGLDDNKAITQFTKAAKDGKPIHIWGDGNTVRSYMHGKDLGRWMWAILLHGKTGEAYDVGDDTIITMLQLATLIADAHSPRVEIIIDGGKDPMPVYLPVDTEKTKRLLR